MTDPRLPICERLLIVRGTQFTDYENALVTEAAALIEQLVDALEMARQYVLEHSDDDGEIEQIDAALTAAKGE